MQVPIHEGTVCRDHIYLCLSVPPKYAISEVIGKIKGKTAIRMFQEFPDF